MGFFDFLFGNRKREEQERLERERLAEQERQRKAEEKRIAQDRERRLAENRRKEEERRRRLAEEKHLKEDGEKQPRDTGNKSAIFSQKETVAVPETENYPIIESISEELDEMACQANYAFNIGSQQAAINAMNQLFNRCYRGNGHILLNVSPNNCQPVGMAFANIAIYLNFNDRDLNSVSAENAFYCLARNFIATGNTFATPAIFTLLLKFQDLLKDKLISTHCTLAEKSIGMPIGMILGGNPFQSPHLADFRKQAMSKRVAIMSYLIQFIYDLDKSEYKIPTDMPYLLPSNKDIETFRKLVSENGTTASEMILEGQKYFYAMFEDCEDTLSKC